MDVAEAAAQAAVRSLSELEKGSNDKSSVTEKEELDAERAISEIAEVQMKEILDKIVHFEELDMQMEKERQQLEQMKHLLFVDKLSLLFHRNSAPKTGDCGPMNLKTV